MVENNDRLRLAAILAADVAGYSRLMGQDERATVAMLTEYREVFRSHIESNEGRVVDMAGDSVLAIFENAIGAAKTAVDVQAELAKRNERFPEDRRMQFRVGVNLGDVIEKQDGTIYGDGINVAARLEAMANPGGANVSGSVFDSVRSKLGASFDFLGEHEVKNIADPVRTYRLLTEGEAATPIRAQRIQGRFLATGIAAFTALIVVVGVLWFVGRLDIPAMITADGTPTDDSVFAAPTGPVIAVLPFDNMSGDPEQEYFTDGITADVITALSRFQDLAVIGRNTTFRFKGKATDLRDIAQELRANYVLKGSVRRSADKVRVTAQLIGGRDGAHLWADSFEGHVTAENLFRTQDNIARQVATRIADVYGVINLSRMAEAAARPVSDLKGYECVLLASYYERVLSEEALSTALSCLEETVVLHPNDAEVLGALSVLYLEDFGVGWGLVVDSQRKGLEIAHRAIEADPRNQRARYAMAYALFLNGRETEFLSEADRAIELNPNNTFIVSALAGYMMWAGEWDRGFELLNRANRLNPYYPPWLDYVYSNYCLRNGDFECALAAAHKADTAMPGYYGSPLTLAVVYAHIGDIDQAKIEAARTLTLFPDLTQRFPSIARIWYQDDQFRDYFIEGLRKAGLGIEDVPASVD